jgi:hypothetical protein
MLPTTPLTLSNRAIKIKSTPNPGKNKTVCMDTRPLSKQGTKMALHHTVAMKLSAGRLVTLLDISAP